jgi:hypothetical protein
MLSLGFPLRFAYSNSSIDPTASLRKIPDRFCFKACPAAPGAASSSSTGYVPDGACLFLRPISKTLGFHLESKSLRWSPAQQMLQMLPAPKSADSFVVRLRGAGSLPFEQADAPSLATWASWLASCTA